jgi:Protein of unknown function (DUF3551)
MNQLKCSSTPWSLRRCSATQSLVDPTTPQNSRAVTMLRYRNHRGLSAVNAKAESRWNTLQPQRLRCNGAGLIALAFSGLIALAFLSMTSAPASAHQYKYCYVLNIGHLRVCGFDTLEQCQATQSGRGGDCEHYPFLAYCHIAPTGQIQRCDFDTLAECQATSSGLAGDCERDPLLASPRSAYAYQPTSPRNAYAYQPKHPYSKRTQLSIH